MLAIALFAPTTAAAEIEHRRDFVEDALVSGASGWARTYAGLYWTDDGGASWRNISPASAHPGRLVAVDFADPEHGWAAAEEGGEARPRAALYATSDGGRTWTRTPIRLTPYAQLSRASFSAVGAHLVFALVRQPSDPALNLGHLFVSRDGGRRWHELPQRPPGAGEIAFASARDGWLAKDLPGPALYRTVDGGRTWREARLPRPPGLGKARPEYLAPRFEADGHGIIAATYFTERRGVTALYSTADRGRHWTLAASALGRSGGPPRIVAGEAKALAYRGGESVLAPIFEAPQLGLLSVNGSVTSLAAAGLPTEYSSLSFSGSEDGFGRIESELCPATAKCKDVNDLYFSDDGGETWTATARP